MGSCTGMDATSPCRRADETRTWRARLGRWSALGVAACSVLVWSCTPEDGTVTDEPEEESEIEGPAEEVPLGGDGPTLSDEILPEVEGGEDTGDDPDPGAGELDDVDG